LSAGAAQTGAPFAFGHPFRQGDVPSGSYVAGDTADWQCSPLTYWPDGSVKHAIIAGRAEAVAGDLTITLRRTTTAPTGANLTEADLRSALTPTTIAAGDFVWTLNGSIGTADLHRTVCAGPVMSNFIYRKPVAGSSHLVLWADVRLYKGGNVEIFPWVENAYFLVANPTNDVRTYSITIGGVQRYSQSIDVKHHTRVPLVTGTTFSYWTGADPGMTPWHDRSYLMATKLVPNYGWLSPSEATLNGLSQSYAPNTLAGISSSMGVAGTSGALIPNAQALYVTSNGDPRAYRAAVVFGLSGGSWSTHYRDENTNDPIKFSNHPGASLNAGSNVVIPSGTGGTNGSAVTTHQPSYGYLPFLITGRWWFWEESAFWATWNYLNVRPNSRRGESGYDTAPFLFTNGAAGVINPSDGAYANRGGHWSIRTLAQTFALCPSSHITFNDWKTAWESNTDYYERKYVAGTFAPWVSPQGFLGDYSAMGASLYGSPNGNGSWFGAGWMSTFGVQAWGFAWDIGLAQSEASLVRHRAVRDHAYKQVVQRAGDGLNGNYNWRRFIVYAYPIGSDGNGLPPETWYTAGQSYTNLEAGYGLAAIPATSGLTLKAHSSDADLAAGTSSASDYGPFGLTALAYAVDHGAQDASAGWARLSGASNFANAFAGLHDNPGHGIVPRGWGTN
jgi:hypothetical protein